jgi:hypothetical protein
MFVTCSFELDIFVPSQQLRAFFSLVPVYSSLGKSDFTEHDLYCFTLNQYCVCIKFAIKKERKKKTRKTQLNLVIKEMQNAFFLQILPLTFFRICILPLTINFVE